MSGTSPHWTKRTSPKPPAMNKPDPYTQRAAEMFNVSAADVSPEQRAIAKADAYAVAYGAPSVWHGRMSAPPFKKEKPE